MIAQGNAISHGARAIEYSMEKDKARLVKVNGLPENIEPLAMWSRMMQHQHQCMKDRYNPKPITLNALRFEISPAKEETTGWSMDDWQDLADEFITVLDSIDRRPGKPDCQLSRLISKIANMSFHYTLIAKVAFHTCTLWLIE